MGHELRISAGVVLNSVEQSEDKNGFRTSYRFSGTRVQCEAQRFLERARGAKQIQIISKGDGNWELVSTYPTDAENGNGDADQPTDTHELDVSMVQQDVWTNPKLKATLSENNQRILSDFVKRYKGEKFGSVDEADDAVFNAAEAPQQTATRNYFRLIALEGVDHWIFYRSVYSRTITLATPRQVQASFEGVQKIWTTAQLTAYENLPNDWYFQLPTGTRWHKSMPKVTTNFGRSSKTQITYQYIGSNEASLLLYDNH